MKALPRNRAGKRLRTRELRLGVWACSLHLIAFSVRDLRMSDRFVA